MEAFDSSPPPPLGVSRVTLPLRAAAAASPAPSPTRSFADWKAAISAALRGPAATAPSPPLLPPPTPPAAVAAAATAAGFRLSFDLVDARAPARAAAPSNDGDVGGPFAGPDAFSFTNFHASAASAAPSPARRGAAAAGEEPSLFAYVPAPAPSPAHASRLRWVGIGRSSPLHCAPTASPFALAPSPPLTGGAWVGSGRMESPAHLQGGGRAPLSPQPLNLLGRFAQAERSP